MLAAQAERAIVRRLEGIQGGVLRLETPGGSFTFGQSHDLTATIEVHRDRFFRRALTGAGDIGIGESYMDGDWTTDDLVALTRLMLRNRHILGSRPLLARLRDLAGTVARRLRDNSPAGSRRHIRAHYDLGNDFFSLFLDPSFLMYSSAYFETASDSLEVAQVRKLERICRVLDLQPGDRVLEIGSGWGGFARWAASRYQCRVTTTTISEEQYRYVRDWQRRAGAIGRQVDVLRADYRELKGQFDKIVSIEMFEAVGLRHYDEYFSAVDRLLTPDGTMMLQTITVDDQWFPSYRSAPDWIEAYIFPGGELASIGEIMTSLARSTRLSMYAAENFGAHYARTLQAWRRRFLEQLDAVRALRFDERFIRMWDFYFATCEAAFLERHTGVFQLLLGKNGARGARFNEPWGRVSESHREAAVCPGSAA